MRLLDLAKRRAGITLLACGLLGTSGTKTSARPQAGVVGGFSVAFQAGERNVGVPYCGTRKTETVQTLSNGTHITHETKSRECRDSQGRLRHENFFPNPQGQASETPTFINIIDPVGGVIFTLDVNRHVAHRTMMPGPQTVPPKPPNPSVAPKPAPSTPNEPLKPQMKMTTEPLESQTIDGLLVDGKRITRTYRAGFQGSDGPITVIEEQWVSKELGGIVVLRTSSDPRQGETTEKLTDIDRSEPDPTLFQVPADYTIEDQH